MKSIQTKFILVMLVALSVCTLTIGGISLSTAKQSIDKDAVQLMSFLCGKQVNLKINHLWIFHPMNLIMSNM